MIIADKINKISDLSFVVIPFVYLVFNLNVELRSKSSEVFLAASSSSD